MGTFANCALCSMCSGTVTASRWQEGQLPEAQLIPPSWSLFPSSLPPFQELEATRRELTTAMTDGFERADERLGEGLKEQDAKIDRNQTVVEQVRVRGAAAACDTVAHSSLAVVEQVRGAASVGEATARSFTASPTVTLSMMPGS